MRIARVYVDTSVIGGCCDPEFATWSNGLLKDFEMGFYRPVISDLVLAELAGAPAEVHEKLSELRECDPEEIQVSVDAQDLAREYVERGVLSPSFTDDATHIALATVAEVDVLVSWNFKHIVHLDKVRMFNAINLEMGFRALQIYSPREVTHHDD